MRFSRSMAAAISPVREYASAGRHFDERARGAYAPDAGFVLLLRGAGIEISPMNSCQ